MQVIFEQNRDSIIKQLKDLVLTLRNQFGVIRIGLFGSFVREGQTSNSDVDILVELREGYNTPGILYLSWIISKLCLIVKRI